MGKTPPLNAPSHILVTLPDCSAYRLAGKNSPQPVISNATLTLASIELDGDAWLVMTLGGELELPIAASTQVVKQGASYLIDSVDGEGQYRIDLPSRGAAPEERELLESCLSSWSTFPAEQNKSHKNRLVLVDEPTGQIVGDLSDSVDVTTQAGISQPEKRYDDEPGGASHDIRGKEPVVVEVSQSGQVSISPLSQMTANYGQSGSSIINAAEYVSRGILFGAEKLSSKMSTGANNFVNKTPATESPLVFAPAAKSGVKGVHSFTDHVAGVSHRTVEVIGRFAGRLGSGIGSTLGTQSQSDGKPPAGWRGTLNKTFVAVNTVLDSIDASAKHLASTGTDSATRVATHKYGPDAGETVKSIGGMGTNVTLVYIDARGVSRKALVKTVGSAAFKAKMTDGREVVLSQNPPDASTLQPASQGSSRSPSPRPSNVKKM